MLNLTLKNVKIDVSDADGKAALSVQGDGNVTIELAFTDYSAVIPADGWKHVDGRWYYMKGYVKQTGWVEVDGAWYYLDTNGVMIHDTTMDIDGVSYTFDSNGVMAEPTR